MNLVQLNILRNIWALNLREFLSTHIILNKITLMFLLNYVKLSTTKIIKYYRRVINKG